MSDSATKCRRIEGTGRERFVVEVVRDHEIPALAAFYGVDRYFLWRVVLNRELVIRTGMWREDADELATSLAASIGDITKDAPFS